MNLSPPAPRLHRFLSGLCTLLARLLPQQTDPAPGFLLWQWLRRLTRQLDRPAQPATPRQPALRLFLPPCPGLPPLRPPQSRGWLLDLSPDFAPHGAQLRALLADPQIQALLHATPRLAASLRRLLALLNPAAPAPARTKHPAHTQRPPSAPRPPHPIFIKSRLNSSPRHAHIVPLS